MREDDDVYPNGEHFSQEMEMSIVKKTVCLSSTF